MKPAKIVAETITPEAQAVKNMIITRVDEIDKKKVDLKNAREMLTNAFENNQEYRDAKEAEKKERNKRQAVEERIKNDNPTPTDKVEEIKEELKDLQEGLSDYLSEFVRMTGKTEIEHPDGRNLRIVKKFKVSPGQQKLF